MSPQAVEMHMILMLMLIIHFLFQVIITGAVISTFITVKSVLTKLKIVGEKVSNE